MFSKGLFSASKHHLAVFSHGRRSERDPCVISSTREAPPVLPTSQTHTSQCYPRFWGNLNTWLTIICSYKVNSDVASQITPPCFIGASCLYPKMSGSAQGDGSLNGSCCISVRTWVLVPRIHLNLDMVINIPSPQILSQHVRRGQKSPWKLTGQTTWHKQWEQMKRFHLWQDTRWRLTDTSSYPLTSLCMSPYSHTWMCIHTNTYVPHTHMHVHFLKDMGSSKRKETKSHFYNLL